MIDAAGQKTFLHHDPLGSTLALSDGGGRVLERHGYGPFGERSDATGAAAFRFVAGRWDAETDLVWFEARAYSASLGRFVSPDPAGYAEGPHLYTYARNNPVGRIDPTGTCSGWASDAYFGYELASDRDLWGGAAEAAAGVGVIGASFGEGLGGSFLSGGLATFPAVGAAQIGFAVGSGLVLDGGRRIASAIDRAYNNVYMAGDGDRIRGLLEPGGKPIGQQGSSSGIRVISGGQSAAEEMFGKLSQGGTEMTPDGHPGSVTRLPDGGYVAIDQLLRAAQLLWTST